MMKKCERMYAGVLRNSCNSFTIRQSVQESDLRASLVTPSPPRGGDIGESSSYKLTSEDISTFSFDDKNSDVDTSDCSMPELLLLGIYLGSP